MLDGVIKEGKAGRAWADLDEMVREGNSHLWSLGRDWISVREWVA